MPQEDLSAASIADNLGTRFIGQRFIYYPRLPSTMDTARQEARNEAAAGTVIMAGEQTRGRGRMERVWLSPRGNIALSVILRPDVSYLPYLVMLASLAAVRSIEAAAGLKAQIKWPNDILISGQKVGGLLIENEVKGSRVDYSIIGIGINLALPPEDAAALKATSLNTESGKDVSRVVLVRHLLAEMEHLYLALPDGEAIYQAWREGLVTLGKRVYAISGESHLEGIAEDVDESGALLLRLDDGGLVKIVAGDVSLREK
jgi:BirA family biotin operon repressor/biotin-[acetyl-CoA-carboxylase] ligase